MDTPAKQAAHDDGSQSPVPVTMRMGSGSPTMSPPSRAPGSNIEDPGLAPQGAGEFNGTAPEGRDRDVGNGPQLGFGPATGRGKVPAIKSADVYRHGSVLRVTKKCGKLQPIKAFKLRTRVEALMDGLDSNHVDIDIVVQKVINGSYDKVRTSELDLLAAETSAYLATEHPDYSLLAGRIAVSALHKNTPRKFSETIKLLHEYVHKDTGVVCPQIADDVAAIIAANAAELDEFIDYGRDYTLDYFAFKTLEKAYLLRLDKVVIERPQCMFMRVAVGIHKDDIESIKQTYWHMSSKFFTHATPTLFNSGTPHAQMSSCFLLQLKEDSVDGIYQTLRQCATISSEAGGIGLSIHNCRARGSYMHNSHGSANGIVPMMRVFNATARLCDQGAGKRPGAFAIYLEPWHAEVSEFLEMKKNVGSEEHRARDLFYALWIPDLFMKRVRDDAKWSLFCPSEAPGLCDCYGEEFEELYCRYEREGKQRKTMNARELWFDILEAQTETGLPYLLYKDSANAKSNQKNLGVIKCSNLCTEIIQYTSPEEVAVCNLASICLPRFVCNGAFDFTMLIAVTGIVTNNLNRIIDHNKYPLPEAKLSNTRHRPIGIGVQGLADTFQLLRLPFDSPKARQLNRDIFEAIYYGALKASHALACEFGPYESFPGSPASKGMFQFDMWGVEPSTRWDWEGLRKDIMRDGIRNSLLVAPMPTASTAQIMGNNECFEPYTSNLYSRRVMAGDFPVINPHLLKDLVELDLWTEDMKHRVLACEGSIQSITEIPKEVRELYKTAWEIKQRAIIDMAADRGAFIDQSQSLNLFIQAPDVGKLTSMHFYAWEKGLKTGCYYLRTRPAVNAIMFTVEHSRIIEVREARASSSTPTSRKAASSESWGNLVSAAGAGGFSPMGIAKEGCESPGTQSLADFQMRKAAARRATEADEPCLMCSS